MKVKENHERVKTRMQEIAIMENMLEKNVGYTPKRKKNLVIPGVDDDQLKCIQNKKPYSLDERSKYVIVRNKKNRSTLNNIHAPRANIEEVN